MKHTYSIRLTAIAIVFGFISVSANASDKATWCDALAYDGGGYWTVRVPVTVENKSGVPLDGDQFRVIVSTTDGTSALIGESVASIRVATSNPIKEHVISRQRIYQWTGVKYLFELENEDGQRKREGVLEAGDVITLPAEVDIDTTITLFIYAGNSEAWLPPDIRDFQGQRSTNFMNAWLEVTKEDEQLKDGVRIQIMPAETRSLAIQQDDLSWIEEEDWDYRVPLRVRNLSEKKHRNRLFNVNTRHVNNRLGKILGFDANPALLLIDPLRPEYPKNIEGDLAEGIRSEVSVEPMTERTLWLYISSNPNAVGKSPHVEFPEGHDQHFKAPYFLDVDAGEIEPREPVSLPLAAWSVDPLIKVFQQDIVPADPEGQVKVYAARNSYKTFQIALRSLEEREVEIQITALKNSNGEELPVPEISKAGYVLVDYPVGYHRLTRFSEFTRFSPDSPGTDGWCDLWPDPLIPVDNSSICKLQANSTQPVWFDVKVPENTSPGMYKGQVILKSDVKDIILPVEVKVWNLQLPDSRNVSVIYDLRRNLDEKVWYKFLAQYNISPGYIRVQPKFTYENGEVSMDADAYDEQVHYLLDELHNSMLYSPSIFRSVGWFTGAKPIFGLEPFTPEYVKAYKDAYRLFIDHITEKGWRKYFVTYLSDEPRVPQAFDAIARVADMAREVAPDVPIYVSAWRHIEEIEGHITAWGIGAKGTFPLEIMEERQKEGDSFIYTTDGEQCLDAPFPATERLMPWFCFKYGVGAYEFWGSTVWSFNPWEYGFHGYLNSFSWDKRNPIRYPNGDGYVIYPGENIGHPGPVPSIRIVAVREGVDDYEIFHALNRFAEEGNIDAVKALDRVRSLVVTPHRRGFHATRLMPDPISVSEARVSAGELLDRLIESNKNGQ